MPESKLLIKNQADIFYGCTVSNHLTRKTEADIRIDAQTLRNEIAETAEALLRKGELNFAIWLRSACDR